MQLRDKKKEGNLSRNNNSPKEGRIYFTIGLIFVGVGIACNEWIVTILFSSDGVLESASRVSIWIFDITLILVGFALIKYRQSIKLKEISLSLSHSHPRMLAFLIGIVFSIIMLIFAEGVFLFLNIYKNKDMPQSVERYSEKFNQSDELLGYKPPPNVQVSTIKKIEEKTVYNVIYSSDDYSRRITPVSNRKNRTNFVLFFGGSYTFGESVNDNETLPFYYSEFASHYMPYNYCYLGYGPQEMLAKLQSGELNKEINEEHGILIYCFITSHIDRAIGSSYVVNNWGREMPYYTIDNNDRLIRKGNFTSGRPLLSFMYWLMGKSQILIYLHLKFPIKINDDHINLTSKIIEESRNTFREKFNSNDFYVLLYPTKSKNVKSLIPYFKGAGIKILDYSNLIDMTKKEFSIEGDGHPTAKAHKIVAVKLAEDLGILDSN